jgi:hypothetical protein
MIDEGLENVDALPYKLRLVLEACCSDTTTLEALNAEKSLNGTLNFV